MGDAVNLGERRAEREQDNTRWSAEDALECALREIRDGTIDPQHLVIHYLEPAEVRSPDDPAEAGRLRHGCYLVNVTYFEHIGILEMAKRSCVERMRSYGED